jgi:peptidoglycan/xylan/chitin deacetylase (PgdA/CDA1 family)
LREVLRRHAMRATFAVPAVIAHIHRDLVRSLAAEGYEIAAHGFRHEDVSGLERDEERRRIARTTEILADVVGRKPAGWFSLPRQGDRYAVGAVSPNTIDLLLEAGYVYLGNGLADDIPYYSVSDVANRRALLTLPYYYHFDDQFFLMFPRKGTGLEHPDALLRNWRGEFAAQYKRGRYFHMTLHPQHIGWSNRLQMLDEFLAEVREYPGLWNPTTAECARYWLETYPASTHLRLEPSIWQDYPGSLS